MAVRITIIVMTVAILATTTNLTSATATILSEKEENS